MQPHQTTLHAIVYSACTFPLLQKLEDEWAEGYEELGKYRPLTCGAGGDRRTAVIIASVVGAAVLALLFGGVIGLIFWVRRKRREEGVRDLSDLGALPQVGALK